MCLLAGRSAGRIPGTDRVVLGLLRTAAAALGSWVQGARHGGVALAHAPGRRNMVRILLDVDTRFNSSASIRRCRATGGHIRRRTAVRWPDGSWQITQQATPVTSICARCRPDLHAAFRAAGFRRSVGAGVPRLIRREDVDAARRRPTPRQASNGTGLPPLPAARSRIRPYRDQARQRCSPPAFRIRPDGTTGRIRARGAARGLGRD